MRRELLGDDFQYHPPAWSSLSKHDQVLYAMGIMSHPGDFFPAPTVAELTVHHASDPLRDDYFVK
eukprot:6282623-Pyramimonas_sp.AAC.1